MTANAVFSENVQQKLKDFPTVLHMYFKEDILYPDTYPQTNFNSLPFLIHETLFFTKLIFLQQCMLKLLQYHTTLSSIFRADLHPKQFVFSCTASSSHQPKCSKHNCTKTPLFRTNLHQNNKHFPVSLILTLGPIFRANLHPKTAFSYTTTSRGTTPENPQNVSTRWT